MSKKKKETRVMRVTMDKDEFQKYDRGETHSDSGIRNDTGQLSALPDIAPIEDSDLPEREVLRTEIIYQDRYIELEEPTFGGRLVNGLWNLIVDIFDDPEVKESLIMLIKAFLHYKVVPSIKKTVRRLKGEDKYQIKSTKILEEKNMAYWQAEIVDEKERIHSNNEKLIVSEDQANMILEEARKKAHELSVLIYLLSSLCIKDDKSDEERYLEQSYIKQLVSEEATRTMRVLLENRQLNIINDNIAMAFEDFLNGYIRNGKTLVPIPIHSEKLYDIKGKGNDMEEGLS